ncbi:TVP38/TMEM64 family protein [Syntrophomonas erecta]
MELTYIAAVSEYIKGFGLYALPLLFILIVLQCHIPILPFAMISAVCGFIFGFSRGIAVSWISVVIGSMIAFYVYRRLEVSYLVEKIPEKYKQIPEEFIFGFIIIAHNIPVIPIAVPNILAALSKISTPKFIVATALGLFIPSISFVAFGSGIETFLVNPSYSTFLPIIAIFLIFYLLKKYSHNIMDYINHHIFKKREK